MNYLKEEEVIFKSYFIDRKTKYYKNLFQTILKYIFDSDILIHR